MTDKRLDEAVNALADLGENWYLLASTDPAELLRQVRERLVKVEADLAASEAAFLRQSDATARAEALAERQKEALKHAWSLLKANHAPGVCRLCDEIALLADEPKGGTDAE